MLCRPFAKVRKKYKFLGPELIILNFQIVPECISDPRDINFNKLTGFFSLQKLQRINSTCEMHTGWKHSQPTPTPEMTGEGETASPAPQRGQPSFF